MNDWRTPSDYEAKQFAELIFDKLLEKFYDGQAEYGKTWCGRDPLDHAMEECLDILWYLWWEKRKLGQ